MREHIDKLKDYLKTIRWIAIALFVIGICLILTSEYIDEHLLKTIVSHIGVAFVVASIIGLIIELTEIKDFFENRILNIVTGKKFIEILSDKKLEELNHEIMKKMIQNKVDNDKYDFYSFPHTITTDILSQIGGVYREDNSDTIEYHVLTPQEIEQIFNEQEVRENEIARITYTARFYLVSPKENEEIEHEIIEYWYVKKIPSINKNNHFEIKLIVDGDTISLNKDEFIKEEGDNMTLDLSYKIKFKKGISVLIETIMYEYGKTGNIASYMEDLTKDINVHFSSDLQLDIDAEIFGLSAKYYDPSITSNAASINYPGWMLPGHGYSISWTEKK